MRLESALQKRILLHWGTDPRLRLWRCNTGAARAKSGALVKFGTTGAADIQGIIRGGRFLAIEVKSPTGTLSPAQKHWGAMITSFGGLYLVARDFDALCRELELALSA